MSGRFAGGPGVCARWGIAPTFRRPSRILWKLHASIYPRAKAKECLPFARGLSGTAEIARRLSGGDKSKIEILRGGCTPARTGVSETRRGLGQEFICIRKSHRVSGGFCLRLCAVTAPTAAFLPGYPMHPVPGRGFSGGSIAAAIRWRRNRFPGRIFAAHTRGF